MALGDGTSGRDPGRVLDRYRPVVLAAVAIALVTWVFPGAERAERSVAAGTGALPAAFARAGSPTTTSPTTTAVAATPPSPALPQVSARPASASPSASPSPTTTMVTTARPAATAAPTPLRPARTAWATATAGTPLAAEGVPAGTLPVGTRLGSTDKASYLTVSGTATALVLHEDADGGRAPETAVVQACAITEAPWTGGEAKSFDEAPAHDPERCVLGTRADDGTWTFEVSGFADRGGDAGFALLPGPDAPVDFQVALV